MSKAVEGAAMLAGAVGMGVAAFYDPALVGSPMFDKILTSLVLGGVSLEAGAIANALTTNRGMAITTRQAAANQQIIYGQQRVGGVIIKQRTSGSSNDQMNYVIVLAGHECDSIQNLYLDGRQVHWQAGSAGNSTRNGINFGGNADGNTYIGPNGVEYNFGGTGHSGIYCEARYGDQLDGDVIGALTANCPEWAADGQGNSPWVGGCTYVYLKIEFNTDLFPNEPDIRFTVNGKNNIWDPRTQSYGFSNSWALVAADILTDPVFGLGDNSVNQLNLIGAANLCDEMVELAAIPGSSEFRYTCNYHYDTSTTPGDALQAIMSGAQGGYSQIGGEYYLWPAAWSGASFSFDASNLTAPFQWNSYHSVPDRINRVNGTYVAPSYPYSVATLAGGNLYDQNGYYDGQIQNNFPFAFQPTNFPQFAMDTLHGYPTDEWLTADNGEEHPLELALTSVLSITQAQRLAKIALMRNRFEGTGVLEMNLSSYVMQPKDIFEFTFPLLGWTNHLLEVTKVDFVVDEDQDRGAQCIRVRYTVVETDPSIYDWTPNSEELTVYDVPASPNQAPASPTPPTNLTLNSGPSVAQINPDGTVNNLIVVGWDTPLDNLAIGIQIQYRVSGTTVWSPAPSQTITLNSSWISNVVPGVTYDVRVSSYRANGQVSTWVEEDGYTVINTPTDLGTLAAQLPVLQQSVGTTAGEMLLNGNFAQGLTDWTTSIGSPAIDTTQYKLGTQSAKLHGGGLVQDVNLVAGHTYLFQSWVMCDGSTTTGGSSGAGIYVYDPSSQLTIQKVNGTAINLDNIYPGSLLVASGATGWTLLQVTFSCATSGTYQANLTDCYGAVVSTGVTSDSWLDGVSLTDTTGGADVTASQPIVTAASSESIVPNGSFQLNNMSGWVQGGFTFGSDGNGYRIYAAAAVGTGAGSPVFNVIPGAKYRMVYTCYNGSGSGGIYLRLAWAGKSNPAPTSSIVPLSGQTPSSTPGYNDFMGNGSVTTAPTGYAYDWVAPAGAYYASMWIYDIAGSDLACQKVECFPYVAVGQYGADVTGNNTSNDTNNVDGIPSSTIAQVVPDGYTLFINNGSREYSFQAV